MDQGIAVGERRRRIDVDAHLLNLAYVFKDVGRLTAYGYYFDYDADEDNFIRFSSLSVGGRFHGQRALQENLALFYTAEFANQQDAGNNPESRDVNYYRADLGVRVGPVTIQATGEILEGEGTPLNSFQTPHANLQIHNGFADRFGITPADGLQDVFLQIGSSIGEKARITGIFHDFRADWGGRRYGREFDLLANYDFNDHSKVAFKLETYWSDQDLVATDITTRDVVKAWLWFRYRF